MTAIKTRIRVVLAAGLLALGLTVTACGEAGATITRLTVGSPGSDPYTLVANTDQMETTPRQQTGGKADGDTPGLYGGTRRSASCDPAQLLEFLQANPDKAKAWAAVHGIGTAGIAGYIGKLTPVTLRVDTLVTNHGYRDGKATNFPAVLQAGIGVLIDEYGTPVVKCNCGNPLTKLDKKIKPSKAKYTGKSWPRFSDKKATVIEPRDKAKGPVQTFTLVDPGATMAFNRPLGTEGEQDSPATELPPTETPDVSPSPDTASPTTGVPTDQISPSTDGTEPTPGPGDPGTPPVTPGAEEGDGNGDGLGTDPSPGAAGEIPPPETNGSPLAPPDGGLTPT